MTDIDIDLSGKVAIITGGGRGFGAAIAHKLASKNCIIAIADMSTVEANRIVNEIKSHNIDAFSLDVDVGDRDSVVQMVDEVAKKFGRIDILVNCAGVLAAGPIIETNLDQWDKVCRVNLSGSLYCAHAVAQFMRANGDGCIVNISSISAKRGSGRFGNVLYGTTKGAVCTMTMGLAKEFGEYGIRVNAILPGVADTEMTNLHMTEEARSAALARIPLGRMTMPEDIANVSLFLVSRLASNITGTLIPVDGGYLVT